MDESLCYSCAYFGSPEVPLADAQKSKLDYICRKLRLKPGQRLLDLGCGWGALVMHAAANYGVEALGLTLSPHQAEVARERIRAAGLASQCRVEVENFLEFRPGETFDRIASVGAAEHVPEKCFNDYFVRAFELLRPAVNFSITRSRARQVSKSAPAARSRNAMFFPIIFSPPSGAQSLAPKPSASKCAMSRAYASTTNLPWNIGSVDWRLHRAISSAKQIL